MFKEFKEFAIKGNAVDLAIGLVLGVAFGAVITSLVNDVLMPPIGALLGGMDFADLFYVVSEGTVDAGPYATLAAARNAGAVVIAYGAFVNAVINFLIVAFALFMVVKGFNSMRRGEEEATSKDCPYCRSEIPVEATRCPACTSELAA